MTTTEDIQVMVPVTITGQMVSDMLISAFEGGSNYWIDNIRLYDREGKRVVGFSSCGNLVLTLSSATVTERESGDHHPLMMPPAIIVEKGLKVMADKYRRHFANFISEDGDAETADVFLQCCLFGEVRYG